MRVTVYAGSGLGNAPEFQRSAAAFATELARHGHRIIYGGGAVGLMGVVADSALAAGGSVVGVMPRSLVDAEVAHPGLTAMHVVETMSERKQLMAELGECFVALPGGSGTLEEITEVWTSLHLGHHAKPVMLFDVDHYWDPLRDMISRMCGSEFLRPAEAAALAVIETYDDFHRAHTHWRAPRPRWMSPLPANDVPTPVLHRAVAEGYGSDGAAYGS